MDDDEEAMMATASREENKPEVARTAIEHS